MSGHDDATLLDRLGAALEVVPDDPSLDEVATLRAQVREQGAGTRAAVPRLGSRRRRARRAVLAAALAATLVLGSGAVALATGGPFSGLARRAAFTLGFPVDSPELSNAKHALAGLRDALAGQDPHRIADARQEVELRLGALSGDDANAVGREARDLLRDADERLTAPPANGTGRPPGGSPNGGDSSPERGGSGGDGGRGGSTGSPPGRSTSEPESSSDGNRAPNPTAPPREDAVPEGSGFDSPGSHQGGS